MVTGLAVLGWVQKLVPGLSPEAMSRLEFGEGMKEEEELAATSIIATGLGLIWDLRTKKKTVTRYAIRALVSILRRSRYINAAELIYGCLEP